MSTAGPTICGTAANAAGSFPWVNPTNFTAEDASFATWVANGGYADYLLATNFGWSLTGMTVTNVKVEVKGKQDGTYNSSACRFQKTDGSIDDYLGTAVLTATNAWQTVYDGAPGVGWAAAIQTNTDRYAIHTYNEPSTTSTVSLDALRTTVTYTAGGMSFGKISRVAVQRAANW